MNKRQVRKYAYHRGISFGEGIPVNDIMKDLKELHQVYPTKEVVEEWIIELVFDCELHDRSFTPFEHTASAINKCENSEELWEVWDEGISSGIVRGVRRSIKSLNFNDIRREWKK